MANRFEVAPRETAPWIAFALLQWLTARLSSGEADASKRAIHPMAAARLARTLGRDAVGGPAGLRAPLNLWRRTVWRPPPAPTLAY